MCLFFIFGVVPKDKTVGREMRFCPYCGRETTHYIVERRMWFTLFFIPLFPVSGKQIMTICEECGLPDTGRAGTYTPGSQTRSQTRGGMKTCPSCGEEVSDRAKYCPNCGYPLP